MPSPGRRDALSMARTMERAMPHILTELFSTYVQLDLTELPAENSIRAQGELKSLREIAQEYVPNWNELTPPERAAELERTDEMRKEREGQRFDEAKRIKEADQSAGARATVNAAQAFLAGFESVRNPKPRHVYGLVDVPADRCRELAIRPDLGVSEFIELTGNGLGQSESFYIDENAVTPRRFDAEWVASSSLEEQVEMLRINQLPPLKFPCTPAELLRFIDQDKACVQPLKVPDDFRAAACPSSGPDAAGADDNAVKPVQPWIQRAREYADEIWKRHLHLNKTPVKETIASEIAARLKRDGGMVTSRGKLITSANVVRYALNPKSNGGWAPPLPD